MVIDMLQSALLAHDTPNTAKKTDGTSRMVALRTALLLSTGVMLEVHRSCWCQQTSGYSNASERIHNTEGDGARSEQVLVDSTTVACAVPRLLPIAVRT